MNEFTRKAWDLADVMAEAAMQMGYASDDSPFRKQHSDRFDAARSALLAHLEGGEQKWQLIRSLIADDAYAMTFQSFGQYRTALLKAIPPLLLRKQANEH